MIFIDADEPLIFRLDGGAYGIDLNEKNAFALREVLAPYIGLHRRGQAIRSNPPPEPVPGLYGRRRAVTDAAVIRAWAAENGYEVSARGRIPGALLPEGS